MTSKETSKGNYHCRNFVEDVFGFAEHHEYVTYGLPCNIPLQKIVIIMY